MAASSPQVLFFTTDQWQAISAIGTVASAVATFIAVCVALRQTRLPYTAICSVSNSVMQIMGKDKKVLPGSPEFLLLHITNTGVATFTVHSIAWYIGPRFVDPHRLVRIVSEPMPYTQPLPIKLSQGESYSAYLPMAEVTEMLEDMAKYVATKTFTHSYVNSLKCGFHLVAGPEKLKSADSRLRKTLATLIRKERGKLSKKNSC